MPFCPKCRCEYKPGIRTCPDCNVELVASLPEEPDKNREEPQYDDWVAIVHLSAVQYAEMLVEALRDEEIPVVLHSKQGHFGVTGQMGPSSYRPIEGAVAILMVPREFVDQADRVGEAILGETWKACRVSDE